MVSEMLGKRQYCRHFQRCHGRRKVVATSRITKLTRTMLNVSTLRTNHQQQSFRPLVSSSIELLVLFWRIKMNIIFACIQCRLQTTPSVCQPRSSRRRSYCRGGLFLWPALRYGTGYQTVCETRPSAETPSDVHWRRFYFQLTCVKSALKLSGRWALQIYLLTYLLWLWKRRPEHWERDLGCCCCCWVR